MDIECGWQIKIEGLIGLLPRILFASNTFLRRTIQKILKLREAASIQSASIGSAEVVNAICNCAGKCTLDNRCKCFKRGLKCTSHCHLKMKKGAKKCCKNH